MPEMHLTSAATDWFAATVKPQHEAAVARSLDARGIGRFLPVYKAPSRWSDRETLIERPLFPGYVFCSFVRARRTLVLQTPGITSIVGFGGAAVPVPREDMERVQAMVSSRLALEPWPFLQSGNRVSIRRGPLRGLDGTVVEANAECRLVVSVHLLQRSVAVKVDRSWIALA